MSEEDTTDWSDLSQPTRHLLPTGHTLRPLPTDVRSGLTAITVLAAVSFVASTTLFLYLAYKIVAWYRLPSGPSTPSEPKNLTASSRRAVDFALGIDGVFTGDGGPVFEDAAANEERRNKRNAGRRRKDPNQFLILLVNLFLADMHQGMAFFLNVVWLRRDAVVVYTPTCFVQGSLISLGDLSSSVFITVIAVHTFLVVVRNYTPPQRAVYVAVVASWAFVYLVSFIPLAATRNGAQYHGYYVRAVTWCWISVKYQNLRLLTHFIFIFIGLVVTSVLYITIIVTLRRRAQKASSKGFQNLENNEMANSTISQLRLSHNPAFLVYPVVYVLCTLPIAVARIIAMSGRSAPAWYLCLAGAMIASNGWLDCIIFGTTRHAIVFGSKEGVGDTDMGLQTFAFMQTPRNRQYGNFVWVQGGNATHSAQEDDHITGGWWSLRRWMSPSRRSPCPSGEEGMSQRPTYRNERRPTIHMDTITRVEVDIEQAKESTVTAPTSGLSRRSSTIGSEKHLDFITQHI